MPYDLPFYLKKTDGGNGALIPDSSDICLRVAPVIQGTIDDVRLSDEIAFTSDDDGVVRTGVGLDSFIRTEIEDIPVVIFDNHNHALYFWYEWRKRWVIQDAATLVHIDMHSDLWENSNSIDFTKREDLEYIWEFTNFRCNVGNYIQPALQDGLIAEVVRIEGEQALLSEANRQIWPNSILNIDLDFFAEDLDDISFELKREVIRHYVGQVSAITISTSPFFISGERAIRYLKNVFL